MARTKSPAVQRTPSEIKIEANGTHKRGMNGKADVSKMLDRTLAEDEDTKKGDEEGSKMLNLAIGIAGIYGCL